MIRDHAAVHVQDRAVVQAMDALVGLLHRIEQRRALALQKRVALVARVPRLRTTKFSLSVQSDKAAQRIRCC